jgi:hypothetical protein
MIVPLFPRVSGLKVENAWGRGSSGLVCCTARLTRAPRVEESKRINRLLKTSIVGTEIVHECRPEEVEEWHTRLVEALSGAWAPVTDVAGRRLEVRARSRKGYGRPLGRRGQ